VTRTLRIRPREPDIWITPGSDSDVCVSINRAERQR
jgi:hypothetical protein